MKYLKNLDHPKYPQKTNKDGTPKSDLVFERKIATANENLTISLIENYWMIEFLELLKFSLKLDFLFMMQRIRATRKTTQLDYG